MSRKTNNLRNRLRIRDEQASRHRREVDDLGRELDLARRTLKLKLDEERNSFARSVMITVEREHGHPPFDQYGVTLRFQPRAYLFYGTRVARELVNLDFMAAEIGHRIGDMVTRSILDQLRKERSA